MVINNKNNTYYIGEILIHFDLPEWDIVFPDSMKYEPDVGVDECKLRVVLSADKEGEISSPVQELQRSGYLNSNILSEEWRPNQVDKINQGPISEMHLYKNIQDEE